MLDEVQLLLLVEVQKSSRTSSASRGAPRLVGDEGDVLFLPKGGWEHSVEVLAGWAARLSATWMASAAAGSPERWPDAVQYTVHHAQPAVLSTISQPAGPGG